MDKKRCCYKAGLLLLAGSVLLLLCSPDSVLNVLYEPEITFAAEINGTYDSLTGNSLWPNTCRLVGDTVRIFCYSTTFTEVDKIRRGDLLRIDLYPDTIDEFTKYNSLFHLARYYDQNESYTINRGDSADVRIRFESKIVAYAPSTGADIELNEVYIATPPLGPGRYLEIKKGHLSGSVHRK